MSSIENIAAEWASEQARSEADTFERTMRRVKPKPDILRAAAETIQRLGAAAQDCTSCVRLPLCNAYQDGGSFGNCDYKWIHADEVRQYDVP